MPRSQQRLFLFCYLVTLPAVSHAQSDLTEISEAFDDGRWDRHWWSIDRRSPPGVDVDLSDESLRFVVPPGAAGRPPAAMKGRFRLEGDFEVQMDYHAHALPQPESEWINIQISIDGPGGPAAVMRTNHSTEGSGYSLWWEPAEDGASGAWEHDPSDSMQGTLRLTRVGRRLTFEFADSVPAAEFIELGRIEYGDGPITSVELWVTVPETRSAVDVAIDDVRVRAVRIIDPSLPADSAIGPRAWYGVVILSALALLGFAGWRVWVWRTR